MPYPLFVSLERLLDSVIELEARLIDRGVLYPFVLAGIRDVG